MMDIEEGEEVRQEDAYYDDEDWHHDEQDATTPTRHHSSPPPPPSQNSHHPHHTPHQTIKPSQPSHHHQAITWSGLLAGDSVISTSADSLDFDADLDKLLATTNHYLGATTSSSSISCPNKALTPVDAKASILSLLRHPPHLHPTGLPARPLYSPNNHYTPLKPLDYVNDPTPPPPSSTINPNNLKPWPSPDLPLPNNSDDTTRMTHDDTSECSSVTLGGNNNPNPDQGSRVTLNDDNVTTMSLDSTKKDVAQDGFTTTGTTTTASHASILSPTMASTKTKVQHVMALGTQGRGRRPSRSLSPEADKELEGLNLKYQGLENDPATIRSLLSDHDFIVACLSAGMSPYTIIPGADQAFSSANSATKSRMVTRARFDHLLQEHIRSTGALLSLKPETLQIDQALRHQVLLNILRGYEEKKRAVEIQSGSHERRADKTRRILEHLTAKFIHTMLEQRSRSQALVDKVFGLRVEENEQLLGHQATVNAKNQHKEDVMREFAVAEERRRVEFHQKAEKRDEMCRLIASKKREMVQEKRDYFHKKLAERLSRVQAELRVKQEERAQGLAGVSVKGAANLQRARDEATAIRRTRHEELVKGMHKRQERFDQNRDKVIEARAAYFEERKVDSALRHWELRRRKSYKDGARRNALLEKVQASDQVNKMVQAFMEVTRKEQRLFDKVMLKQKYNIGVQEQSFERFQSPGPGQYLGPDAARVLKTAKGFTFSNTSQPRGVCSSLEAPGPGEYDLSYLTERSSSIGGLFSQCQSGTYIDEEMRRAAEVPGPGEYNANVRRKRALGGEFRKSRSPSEMEKASARGRELPGPGDYMPTEIPSELLAPFLDQLRRASRDNLMEIMRYNPIEVAKQRSHHTPPSSTKQGSLPSLPAPGRSLLYSREPEALPVVIEEECQSSG